jgi:multisite-specific tRNA:(cytosine-C5)-methyltransferase
MFPKVADGGWKNLGEIGERVHNIPMGCCVLRIEPSSDEDGFDERIVIPLWRSMHSLNLMLAKEDRTAMLLRIFNDTTPLINNHNVSKNKPKPEAASIPNPEVKEEKPVEAVVAADGKVGEIRESANPGLASSQVHVTTDSGVLATGEPSAEQNANEVDLEKGF